MHMVLGVVGPRIGPLGTPEQGEGLGSGRTHVSFPRALRQSDRGVRGEKVGERARKEAVCWTTDGRDDGGLPSCEGDARRHAATGYCCRIALCFCALLGVLASPCLLS